MTGLELLTAAQNGLGVAVFVLRDRELAQIAQFQSTALGRKSASELPDYDLAGLARSLGVEALALANDAGIREAVARAKAVADEGRPVLVDVAIDYSGRPFSRAASSGQISAASRGATASGSSSAPSGGRSSA